MKLKQPATRAEMRRGSPTSVETSLKEGTSGDWEVSFIKKPTLSGPKTRAPQPGVSPSRNGPAQLVAQQLLFQVLGPLQLLEDHQAHRLKREVRAFNHQKSGAYRQGRPWLVLRGRGSWEEGAARIA